MDDMIKNNTDIKEENQESWDGWGDFLGNIGAGGNWTKKVLLKFLKEYRNNFINASGAELLLLLEESGLEYKLKSDSKFKFLIKNEEGSEERKDAVDEYIFDLEKETSTINEDEVIEDGEVENSEEDELEELDVSDEETEEEEENKLLKGRSIDTFKLLDHDYLHIDDKPEEFVTFLVENRINILWNSVINNELTIDTIKKETGAKYFTLIKNTFLKEYEKVCAIKNPANYDFKKDNKLIVPSLMQKLATYRLSIKKFYGNWSGVGTGKTLASVYAGRHLKLKNTVVVTFNSTVDGWEKSLKAYFPDSVVHKKMKKDVVFEEGKYNYMVVNYEFFQTPNAETKLYEFLEQNDIDYLVLDEVHSVKQRDEEEISHRRELMVKFINTIKEQNPKIYSMVMTATPVINNLIEAKKMLELLHGKNYDTMNTNPRIVHAGMKFHLHFAVNGVRYRESKEVKKVKVKTDFIDIEASELYNRLEGVSSSLAIDQITLDHKLEAIKKHVRKGTIIFSYFVDGIVDKVADYIEGLGLTVGKYTGQYKEGLDVFRNGEVDVLVGSSPMGTGVDGLQEVCNRMIILSLPWTYAEYDQLIGRIARQGSEFNEVNIIIPQVIVEYLDNKDNIKHWSRDRHKWNIINFKKDLFSIVMDGIIPNGIVNDLAKVRSKSLKKLNTIISKINNGEFSLIRKELDKICLENKDYITFERRLGDFSKMNKEWSIQKSSTTYKSISSNPKIWKYYHKKYREARENWDEIPFEEIGKKIRQRIRPEWIIADLGCGEGLLRNEVDNKIVSFDYYAIDDDITACDISNLPLENESTDVAVFSLSLMGSNYKKYFEEAHRILKGGSWIFVAEPKEKWEGRANGVDELKQELTDVGFLVLNIKVSKRFVYVDAMKNN